MHALIVDDVDRFRVVYLVQCKKWRKIMKMRWGGRSKLKKENESVLYDEEGDEIEGRRSRMMDDWWKQGQSQVVVVEPDTLVLVNEYKILSQQIYSSLKRI